MTQYMKIVIDHETFGKVTVKYRGTKQSLIQKIRAYGSKERLEKGYVRLYMDPMEKVTETDVRKEIDDKIVVIEEALSPEALSYWLEQMKVKKNGKFKKNTVATIFRLENCCRFSQREGMKWLVPTLHLKAIEEDVVILDLVEKWTAFLD